MSPSVLLDGPLGLEGTHTVNGFTFNDRAGGLPMAVLSKITGLHDMSDADDPRNELTEQIGELPYPTLRRGKTLVYNGDPTKAGGIIAADLMQVRALASSFRAAASSTLDMALAIAPHPDFGGPTLTGFGRPSALTIDDEIVMDSNNPWGEGRAFIFSFRMRDPRFFDLADSVDASAADGTAATMDMPGNAPSEPTFAIVAPGGVVTLENVTLSRTLTFLATLPSGALAVNFGSRTCSIGSADVAGHIDWDNTNWWDEDAVSLQPGTNSVKVTGGAWAATAYPAVW
jgi:hypothetical protein